jgi:probable F420-dependent oxidoreductase
MPSESRIGTEAEMQFSLGMPGLDRYPPGFSPQWAIEMEPADFQTIARTADDLGYDSVNIPEHVVMPDNLAGTMGAHWPHALTAMTFIAGATSRIRVNSCVIVLPYHNPIVFAKAVATLDVMSGGRVMLTFGVGHAQHEFEILGVPFHQRGRITDEYLEAMLELWTADEPSFQGEFVRFKGARFEPKPRQKPFPPLWFGGNSQAAMRRVARYGTGWMPWLITPDELPARLDQLRQLPGYGEKGEVDIWLPPSPLRIREDNHELTADKPVESFSSPQEVIDALGRLRDIGVTWTGIPYPGPAATTLTEYLERLQWGAETVMPLFR